MCIPPKPIILDFRSAEILYQISENTQHHLNIWCLESQNLKKWKLWKTRVRSILEIRLIKPGKSWMWDQHLPKRMRWKSWNCSIQLEELKELKVVFLFNWRNPCHPSHSDSHPWLSPPLGVTWVIIFRDIRRHSSYLKVFPCWTVSYVTVWYETCSALIKKPEICGGPEEYYHILLTTHDR